MDPFEHDVASSVSHRAARSKSSDELRKASVLSGTMSRTKNTAVGMEPTVLDQYGSDSIITKLSASVSYFDVIASGEVKEHHSGGADSDALAYAQAASLGGACGLVSDENLNSTELAAPEVNHMSSNTLQHQHFSEWLESETSVDVAKLRAAAMQYGVPKELRAEVWKYLLGMSKPERSGELSENKKRAALYEERIQTIDENDSVARHARAEARRRMQQRRVLAGPHEEMRGVDRAEPRVELGSLTHSSVFLVRAGSTDGIAGNSLRGGPDERGGGGTNGQDSSGASSSSAGGARDHSSRAGRRSSSSSISVPDDDIVGGSESAIASSIGVGAGGAAFSRVGGRSAHEEGVSGALDAATAEVRERIIGRVIPAALAALGGDYEYNADLVSLLMPFTELMHTEHDTFYCFYSLLQRQEEVHRADGHALKRRVASFLTMFRGLQTELWEHFENEEINALLWVPSWLRSLLARQLPGECVLRLWDTYFASRDGLELHPFVCLAMIDLVQEELLELDGGEILAFLHALPSFDMDQIITHAHNVREDAIGRGIL